MWQLDWQNVTALAITAWALGYLMLTARRAMRQRTKPGATACGGCQNCPTPQPEESPGNFVASETLTIFSAKG